MILDEILAGQEDIESYLAAPLSDVKALERERRVVHVIWREHEAWVKNDVGGMAKEIQRGLKLAPDNTYLQYLKRAHKAHAASQVSD